MWCNFEISKIEDETISNMFSSRGIFKLHSEGEVEAYPRVQASVQNKKMVVAIDKSLVLLEDEMVAKCSFLNFNSHIDVMTISTSGNLIVCGLRDGEIHGIFIKGMPLFTVVVKAVDINNFGSTFVNIEQIGSRFYIMCTNGSLYSLSEIDESSLADQLNVSIPENETIAYEKSLIDTVNMEKQMNAKNLNNLISAVFIPNDSKEPSVVACSRDSVHFYCSSEDSIKVDIPARFGGVKRVYNLDNYLIVLTNSGHLLEICCLTNTICYNITQNDDDLYEDLLIMESNEDCIELLVLTKSNETESRQMKFIEYPSLRCTNELDVQYHTWLVQQPKSSVNLYYMASQQENSKKYPIEVEMLLVSETHPSERFKKLVARGHLEEAEEFGVQFELSLQPLYEAKARKLIVELCNLNENDTESLDQLFIELFGLLKKIENPEFYRKHRMLNISSRKHLEKYLNEMLKHFSDENPDDEDHILEINEQLHRLKTLGIIDPYKTNSDWQSFIYHSHLIKMITNLFKTDVQAACLIWKRHCSSIIPRHNEKELRLLLSLIPTNTEPFNLILWLRQFVPTISSTHPNILPFITEWSIQKTRALQFSNHWPEIGLEFSTKVAEIFQDIKFIHSDVSCQHERNISKLNDLVNALQDLSVLKKTYNLNLTLDNYLQDSIEDTAVCILQHVHLDNLKSLVNDFLYPIFQEKGSTPVAAIRRYISFLVANRNSLSSWLDRSVACIELFHSEDDRLETALLVLQNSPVPWPEAVTPLIKFRTSTHPLGAKISAEHDIQVLKIMKKKYGWPVDRSSQTDLTTFIFRIIKMDLPDMLEDIRILTKAIPDTASEAHYICSYELAKRGRIDEAFDFYKILRNEKDSPYAQEVCEFIADVLENSISGLDDKSREEEKNLIDFYKLMILNGTEIEKKRGQLIQNRFLLRHKYKLTINSIAELIPYHKRIKYFEIAMENIIERSQATTNVVTFLQYEMNELCNALMLEKGFGTLRLCQRMKVLQLSCSLAYYLLGNYKCTTQNQVYLKDLALELTLQAIQDFKKNKNLGTSLINENDPLVFPLIYELLTLAYMNEKKNICDLSEFISYIMVASSSYPLDAIQNYYHNRENEINELIVKALDEADISIADNTLNFSNINASFDVPAGKPFKKRPSVSVFDQIEVHQEQDSKIKTKLNENLHISRFVARTLLLLVIESEPKNENLKQLKKIIPEEIRNEKDVAHEEFFLSLEYLIKSKTHDVWYKMAMYLLDYQRRNECQKIINSDFVSVNLRRVFRNALLNKDVNLLELFAMLIADSHAPALLKRLENEIKTDQQRINLLRLQEMYNTHIDELSNVESIRLKRLKHYYYMEFCKQDPTIKGKFNADFDNIELLLKEFHNKQVDVKLLEQMSRDFAFDYEKILITQVLSILQAQELQYEIKTDDFGDEELVVITTVESIKKLCQPYLNQIQNVDLLTSKLKVFIEEINLYFYELYLCVIELLLFYDAALNELQIWSSILHFLKHKMIRRRRNRPGPLENELWLQSQKEIGVLPKIARYRLPFKPIVEQPLKDILDGELNVDNCQSWLPLIQMHTVLKGSKDIAQTCDYFCMSAVKNSIAEYKASNDSEVWHLQPTNNAFLQAVLRLVKHVQNPSKAFLILYFVSNYAPDGADQVEAAYECYKYALEKESLITDQKSIEQLAKIKRKYPILKTQHLLHVYNLVDEKLMRLIENPAELIYSLYHHEIILRTSCKLDINTVAKEIAKLHDLDLEQIQYKLLHKFLSFTMETPDGTVCEETFLEDQNFPDNCTENTGSASENVIRANYILNGWPKKEAVQFLIAHIFSTDAPSNTSKQLQMYECLTKLNDGSISFESMINQKQYINIKCVHELKKLGYNFSVEKFADCNKIDILKTIWKRNGKNPQSLDVMANICLGYDICLPPIWNGILKRMVMANKIKELNALVEILSSKTQLLYTEGLVVAWEYVLKEPFRNANQTRSYEQEEILKKSLFRIQGCPVLHSMNLIKFVEICMRLDRTHMAAVIMALCQNTTEVNEMKKLILYKKNSNLKKEILDLEDAGIYTVVLDVALKILEL